MLKTRNFGQQSNHDKNFNVLCAAAEQSARRRSEYFSVPGEEQTELHSMARPAGDPGSFRAIGSNPANGDLLRSQGRLFQERGRGLSNSGNHPGNGGTVEEEPARQTVAGVAVSRESKGRCYFFLAGHSLCGAGLLLPLQVTIGLGLFLRCVLVYWLPGDRSFTAARNPTNLRCCSSHRRNVNDLKLANSVTGLTV